MCEDTWVNDCVYVCVCVMCGCCACETLYIFVLSIISLPWGMVSLKKKISVCFKAINLEFLLRFIKSLDHGNHTRITQRECSS